MNNIFFISLKESTNRREALLENLNKFDLKATHIEAIDGRFLISEEYRLLVAEQLEIDPDKLTYEYFRSKSNFNCFERDINYIMTKVGCFLSHMLCLKNAIQHDLDSLLILEDDAIIKKQIEFEYPANYDGIIYLGGFFFQKKSDIDYFKNKNSKYFNINSNFLTVFGTVSYFLPSKNTILDLYNIYKRCFLDGKPKRYYSYEGRLLACPADRMLINYYQKTNNSIMINPQLVEANMEFVSTICDKPKYLKQQRNFSKEY